ncbi:ABC transporter, putative, partial [Bodo saltans]
MSTNCTSHKMSSSLPQNLAEVAPSPPPASPTAQETAVTVPPPVQAFNKTHAPKRESLHQSSLASMSLDATVDFTWENLNYDVEVTGDDGKPAMKTLLHNESGTARGGRVLAVMGPSGAGKTTLMSGVIGRLQTDAKHKLSGCVFLNDTVFTERYKKLVSL